MMTARKEQEESTVRTPRNHHARMLLCLLAIALVGCRSAPRYERPGLDLPASWQQDDRAEHPPDEEAPPLREWWNLFDDPDLTRLVERALAEGLDVQSAALRIEEAMALRGVARGPRVPSLDATGMAQTARLSDREGGAMRDSRTVEAYSVGLEAGWELDLWGRIRQSIRAADANHGIAIEDYHDTLVLLAGEMARQYFTVRELQQRIELLQENIRAQERTLHMTRGRHDAGLAPALDVHQAELNVTSSQASLIPLHNQLALALNRLAVLTGQHPGAIQLPPQTNWTEVIPDFGLQAGLPADLLNNRPDIRRAEQHLMAQTARLGVARADLLPRITLAGTFALQAEEIGDMGGSGSQSYRLGPSLHLPLFQGGRLRSQVTAEESRLEQAILEYQNTVLHALEEVENSWISYQLERDRYALIQRSVTAAEQTAQQVHTLYESGLVPFLNVLDAERSLVQQHDLLAQSRGQIYRNITALYRTLGSGWLHQAEP